MKITDFQTFAVANPPPHFGGQWWMFLQLKTDGGTCGVGEAYGVPFSPPVTEAMLRDLCERYVVGADPFKIERLWRIIHSSGYTQRSDLALMGLLSAIETACWDIVGKELDKPVYELLGGQIHQRLRSYTYLYPDCAEDGDVYGDPEAAARKAAEYVRLGFTAVKFDPVGPYTAYDPRQLSLEALERAEAFVKAIREAVGGRCDLLFGTHGQMTAASAIRLARRLEPYDPLWFEEPVPPENTDEMALVARATTIPVATGERLATKYAFRDVLSKQAAAILQPALGRCGGILEAKKIASLAEAHYAQVAPHLYCGPIAGAADIQLATCTPNFLIQESIRTWDGFHTEILERPIQWEDGYIVPPTAPGIGVTLNEEVATRHRWSGGDALQLQVHNEPI